MQARDRYWYYKVLRVGMRDLCLDEDTYRELLRENGAGISKGKYSATTMSIPQLETALEKMKQSGFKLKRSSNSKNFRDGMIGKCRAIWGELHRAGVMRQPFSEESLTKFAARHTGGVAHIKWADTQGLRNTIEALKGMAHREHVEIQ